MLRESKLFWAHYEMQTGGDFTIWVFRTRFWFHSYLSLPRKKHTEDTDACIFHNLARIHSNEGFVEGRILKN